MKEQYFIISNSDGDTTIDVFTKEQLLKAIQEQYWGEREILTEIPADSDTNYWGNAILIIKGNIVTPVAKQVITKYDIE